MLVYDALVAKGYNCGFIRMTPEALEEFPDKIQKIYAHIVPVSIDWNPMLQLYKIKAFSTRFRPLIEGEMIPTYNVSFFDEIDCVKFEEETVAYEYF